MNHPTLICYVNVGQNIFSRRVEEDAIYIARLDGARLNPIINSMSRPVYDFRNMVSGLVGLRTDGADINVVQTKSWDGSGDIFLICYWNVDIKDDDLEFLRGYVQTVVNGKWDYDCSQYNHLFDGGYTHVAARTLPMTID